jgi:hypothetical protein
MWTGTSILQDGWHISRVEGVDALLPIPPILRYQLEAISQMQVLSPLQEPLLNGLQESMRKRDNWYLVFSTIFVLLHNCDLELRQHKPCSRIRHSNVSLALNA